MLALRPDTSFGDRRSEVSAGDQFNVIITGEEATGKILKEHGATKFTGYKEQSGEGTVLGILKSGTLVEEAEEGDGGHQAAPLRFLSQGGFLRPGRGASRDAGYILELESNRNCLGVPARRQSASPPGRVDD